MKALSGICLLVALGVLLLVPVLPGCAQPAPAGLAEQVDAYVAETMRRLPIPGMAVGIVQGDQVLHVRGYGTANASGDPVTPQTPFVQCSITKSFTALAVRQLAIAGKINLDAPVQTYIPEFRLADPAASRAITVDHLLEHTSGISKAEGNRAYLNSPNTDFAQAIDQLARFRPQYRPGEHYEYSNWNYVLLAEVVTRTSGKPYAEYIETEILDPLDMTHSNLAEYHTLPGAATERMISFGLSVPWPEQYVPVMLGAAGLSASAEDMTHYLIAILSQGQYHGYSLLPARGNGWYDPFWSWHAGQPGVDDSWTTSGGHVSANASITLFHGRNVGVVVLMNTLLSQLLPGPATWDIAINLGRMAANSPYELPSNRAFYAAWAVFDGVLLLLVASIVWQALKLKSWSNHYKAATRAKRIAAWLGIVFDLLICYGIYRLGVPWDVSLSHRPDFSIPLLAAAACLGALGLVKAVWAVAAALRGQYKVL